MQMVSKLILRVMSVGLSLLMCASLVAAPSVAHANERVLFIGNSYTFFSAPTELKVVVRKLMQEVAKSGTTVFTQEVTGGGYQLHQHATDAKSPGSSLYTALQDTWTAVVLQEQSQIPAFKAANHPSYAKSVQSFLALNAAAEKTGAETIALLTWGRRDGDKQNTWLSPFSKMQQHLTAGYQHYAKTASTPTRKVYIAPVGPAFAHIHDNITAGGGDPLKAASLFFRLYDADGSHPSVLGSYLAGLVVFATITGVDVTTTTWAPAVVSAADATALRLAAKAVVVDGPWKTNQPGPDAGSTDAGSTDAGSTDAGSTDAADPSDVGTKEDAPQTPDSTQTDASSTTDSAAEDAPTADVQTAKDSAGGGTLDTNNSDTKLSDTKRATTPADTAGTTPTTPTSTGDDSGCTTSSSGSRQTGLMWLLSLGLGLIWYRRSGASLS